MYNYTERLAEMQKLGLVQITVEPSKPPMIAELKNPDLLGAYPCKAQVSFQLILEVRKLVDVFIFFTQGDSRNINLISDKSASLDTTAIFSKNIGTTTDNGGRYTTKNNPYQTNGVWFMSLADKKLQMWEVAIVTDIVGELSHYYLSLQLVYQADMYKKKGELWIPPDQFTGYDNWHSLQDLLQEVVDARSLKAASRYKAVKVEQVKLADNQAKMLWFSNSRRYGFAELGDGRTCRLHASQVLNQDLPAFEPGQVIVFDSLKITPQGADLIGAKEI